MTTWALLNMYFHLSKKITYIHTDIKAIDIKGIDIKKTRTLCMFLSYNVQDVQSNFTALSGNLTNEILLFNFVYCNTSVIK